MFILAVIAGVGATVLLANDKRNLKTLALSFGIPLPSPVAGKPVASKTRETPRVYRPTPRWPWPDFATAPSHIEPNPTPADMCSGQAVGTMEIPAFAESEKRGWECSMLRDNLGANHLASLFMQARGAMHEPADNIRVKFNLAKGRLSGDLAVQALSFMRLAAAMPRDPALSETIAKLLTTQTDFYFFAGYQSLTFRQEIGDPGRYNLIGVDRVSKALTDHPRRWPTEPKIDSAEQGMKTGRIPPLLTLPAGSH